MTYVTNTASETEAVGYELAKILDNKNVKRLFIAMRGEMGVGKTAFTRGFASYFGISGVKSPTYTIVNEYRGKVSIFHFDMYRLQTDDDLYSIGFDDYIERDGFCIAEWSENITEFLPNNSIFVTITRTDKESERKIEIDLD
jgi:tRNA threonylcarbamoyladenosine biosynthesis protein TsaE